MFIPTSSIPLRFTPPCLGDDTKVEFTVLPITAADTDAVSAVLFRNNISPITTDTFRATLIDEIFNIFPDETIAEENAQILDEYWQCEDVYGEALARWNAQEEQRLFDEQHGAPKTAQALLPQRSMSVRRRSQALLLVDRLREGSERIREITLQLREYEPAQRAGITRMVLQGWKGVSTPFGKESDMVPPATYAALTEEIGRPAILELEAFVNSQGALAPREVGNSGSPPDTEPAPTGSQETSGASEQSDGSSTKSSTAPAQPGASDPIIAAS